MRQIRVSTPVNRIPSESREIFWVTFLKSVCNAWKSRLWVEVRALQSLEVYGGLAESKYLSLLFITLLAFLSPSVVAVEAHTAVYVSKNPHGTNQVAAYLADSSSGRLSLLGIFDTGGAGRPSVHGNSSHALVSDGNLLFVVNSGDDSISSLRITSGGDLKLIGRYPSGGHVPVSLAVRGQKLMVLNQGDLSNQTPGSLTAFNIASDGSLKMISGAYQEFSADDLPVEVLATSLDGWIGVSLHDAGIFEIFRLGEDGFQRVSWKQTVSPPYGGATLPSGATGAMSPSLGNLFLITLDDKMRPGVATIQTSRSGRSYKYHRDKRINLVDPCWSTVSPDGKRFWVSSFATRILSLYRLGGRGRLTWISDTAPVTEGPGGLDIAQAPDGRHLYRLRAFDVLPPFSASQVFLDVFVATDTRLNAGLTYLESLALPSDWFDASPMGLVAVQVP